MDVREVGNNIEVSIEEVGFEEERWMELTQDRVQ
jgi:hypothetical protein